MSERIRSTMSPSRFRPAPRRGLRREEAAEYVGLSASKFMELVKDGRMPKPIAIDGRLVWDVHQLDASFDALVEPPSDNPWDAVLR